MFSLMACEKHDIFNQLTITGEVGPQTYWELASSAVTAGQEMKFDAQYYTSVKDVQIDRSEVWYDTWEILDETVSCPWTVSFSYSYTSLTSTRKRISQKIKEYPHALAQWSDSLHAYAFSSSFPVSGTLSPFNWSKPTEFDSTKMALYFGDSFMEDFKNTIHGKMQYADYKKMMMGMGFFDDFSQFTDSTWDDNTASFVYHFPKNAAGESPVPEQLTQIFNDSIDFAALVYDAANSCYNVDYKRTYKLNAIMRTYDERGVYGTTISKELDVN